MNKKIKQLLIGVFALINGLSLAQNLKIVPPQNEVKQNDVINIKKIIVNGISYTSSPITIYKNSPVTIQVDYTITKQTPSFTNSGAKAECFAKKSTGSNYTIFLGNGSFPVTYGETKNLSQSETINNSSALIDSNNKGKIQMVYETYNSNGPNSLFIPIMYI